MTVRVVLLMMDDVFKYARRVRTILRIAAWLEIVPFLGTMTWYIGAIFFATRVMKKRHNEALEERNALLEQYALFLQEQQGSVQETQVTQEVVAQRAQQQEMAEMQAVANDNDERSGVEAAMRRLEMRRPPREAA
jgi:hypothetical protein